MIASAFIGIIGGLLLGGRYKVASLAALLPATALLMLGLSLSGRMGMGAAIGDFFAIAVGLQVGYLSRLLVSAWRKPREAATPLRTTG